MSLPVIEERSITKNCLGNKTASINVKTVSLKDSVRAIRS